MLSVALLAALATSPEITRAVVVTALDEPRVEASADFDSARRTISVRYASEASPPLFVEAATREHSVAFAPQALAWLGPSTLCVAGIEFGDGVRGATVIEAWELSPPRVLRAEEHGIDATVEPGELRSLRTLYRGDVPGLREVRALAPLRAAGADPFAPRPDARPARAVLAVFGDSRDLWSIERDGLGRMRRQAGPIDSGAPVVAPLLAREDVRIVARRLAAGGVGYHVFVPTCVVSPDDPHAFLWDRDEDGVVDGYERLAPGEWDERGYSNGKTWMYP